MFKSILSGPILFILFFLSISISVKAESTAALTLKQAVDLALEHSTDYLTAKNNLEIARLGERNAWAGYFPTVDLLATHGKQGLDPAATGSTTTTSTVSNTSISLTENLYDNGETIKKHQIADFTLDIAQTNFKKIKATVIRQTVLAYYQFAYAAQNLNFSKKTFSELDRLSSLASNQFHQGLKVRKDYLSFKARSERARLAVLDAESALVTARSNLFLALGISPDPAIVLDENIQPVLPKKPLTMDLEYSDLYEAKVLSLQRQISDLQVSLSRRNLWPQLNLIGSASYGSSNYIDTGQSWNDNDVGQWSVLLVLKFNILDWGVRSRNIDIAAATQNSIEQQDRASLLAAQENLETFKQDNIRLVGAHKIAKELKAMEEDTYHLMERDYRSGQVSSLELSTELANLLDAQARSLQADYDEGDLYLRWKYYKGTLNEETVLE